MCRPVALFCVFLAVTPFAVNALTEEQKAKIHQHFEEVGIKCIKDNPITEDDINNLRSKKLPTGPNAPCFLACMMRDVGVMDDKGMLQKENALEMAKKVFEDPEELKNIEGFLHSCHGLNDEAVSDGDKGCDRAVLAFNCMLEKAPQFGLEM